MPLAAHGKIKSPRWTRLFILQTITHQPEDINDMAPKPKFNTLTTVGRIAKAAYEREQKETSSKSQPPADKMPPPPPAKKRKVTVLPPPSELAAEAARKAEAKKKPPKRKTAPLTAQEKVAEHATKCKKARQVVVHDGKKLKAVKGGGQGTKDNKQSAGTQSKKAVGKSMNLMDFMRDAGQMDTLYMPKTKKAWKSEEVKLSVLVRPTERTRRLQLKMGQQVRSQNEECNGKNIMSLPLALRQRIWRLAVVETQFFVYPVVSTEQPDLAMTCRQIRNEVLPIYYGENTFAIEIPADQGKESRDKAQISLKPVEKWIAALRKARHAQSIKRWAFIWTPTSDADYLGSLLGGIPIGQDAIVSLEFHEDQAEEENRHAIQVHRQASCLLQTHEEFENCSPGEQPEWLKKIIRNSTVTRQYRGDQVILVAKNLASQASRLLENRCSGQGVVIPIEQ